MNKSDYIICIVLEFVCAILALIGGIVFFNSTSIAYLIVSSIYFIIFIVAIVFGFIIIKEYREFKNNIKDKKK